MATRVMFRARRAVVTGADVLRNCRGGRSMPASRPATVLGRLTPPSMSLATTAPATAADADVSIGDAEVLFVNIINRHGARAPFLNMCAGSDEEAAFLDRWRSRLPPESELRELQSLAPLDSANDAAIDAQSAPLGNLTRVGVRQCRTAGQKLRARYRHVLAAAPSLSGSVAVRASNFRRTQLSAAALLEGLLHNPDGDEAAEAKAARGPVPVVTAPQSICSIAAFDSDNGLRTAAGEVFTSERMREAEAKPEVRAAAKAIRKGVPVFASGAAPFRWIGALDLFQCSAAAGDEVDPWLTQHRDATIRHCTERFRIAFEDHDVLCLAAGGLLRDILQNFEGSLTPSPDAPHRIGIFSGHDTTLSEFALPSAARESPANDRSWWCVHAVPVLSCLGLGSESEWPAYATTLALELRRLSDGQVVVVPRLNGEPVASPVDGPPAFVDEVEGYPVALGAFADVCRKYHVAAATT